LKEDVREQKKRGEYIAKRRICSLEYREYERSWIQCRLEELKTGVHYTDLIRSKCLYL
jgi:hypothetical protein